MWRFNLRWWWADDAEIDEDTNDIYQHDVYFILFIYFATLQI